MLGGGGLQMKGSEGRIISEWGKALTLTLTYSYSYFRAFTPKRGFKLEGQRQCTNKGRPSIEASAAICHKGLPAILRQRHAVHKQTIRLEAAIIECPARVNHALPPAFIGGLNRRGTIAQQLAIPSGRPNAGNTRRCRAGR